MNQKLKRLFFRRRFNNFSNGSNALWTLCDYFRKSIDFFSPGNWDAYIRYFKASDPVSVIRKRVDELEKVMSVSYKDEQLRLRKISASLFAIVVNCFVTGWVIKFPKNSKGGAANV